MPDPLISDSRYRLIACATPFFAAFLPVIFLISVFSYPVHAQVQMKTMIIIDGSRSMRGYVDQKKKYAIAVSSVERILAHRASESILGVMAFGHLRRRSCQSVELIKEVSTGSSEEILAKLRSLRPGSLSPVARSLELAATRLDYQNSPAKIILIVDGNDNCRRNPCDVIRDLRKTAYDISFHMIGLELNNRDLKIYECFREHRNDAFYPVTSEKDLLAALFVATGVKPRQEYKPPVVDDKQIASLLSGAPRISLLAVENEGAAPLREGVTWKVYKAVKDSSFRGTPVSQSSEAQPVIPLAPGNYIVEVLYGHVRTEQVVVVPKSGSMTNVFDLNSGSLQVETRDRNEGQTLDGVFYAIHRTDRNSRPEPVPVARSNDTIARFIVKAGDYMITASHGGNRIEQRISVRPGEHAKLQLEMNIGMLDLSTVVSQGGPVLEEAFYSVFRDDGASRTEELRPGDEVSRTAAAHPVLRLPSGRYIVKAEHGLASAFLHVLIKPGETTKARINLQAATLTIRSVLKGHKEALNESISYQIHELNAPTREIARTTEATKTYILSPGKYRVTGKYGVINSQAHAEASLKPGEKQEIVISHDAGQVSLALVSKKGKYPKINVFWTVYDSKDNEIWRTSRHNPEMILKSGRYKAVAESDKARYEQKFAIENGKKTEIRLESD